MIGFLSVLKVLQATESWESVVSVLNTGTPEEELKLVFGKMLVVILTDFHVR